MAQKDTEVALKTDALRKDQEELARARGQIEDQVTQRLAAERAQLIATEAKKARQAAAAELCAKEAESAELRTMLETNNAKLVEAQQAQASLIRKQRELDDAKRELELTVEKRVQSSVDAIRSKARQDADEAARLRISEKDQTIGRKIMRGLRSK